MSKRCRYQEDGWQVSLCTYATTEGIKAGRDIQFLLSSWNLIVSDIYHNREIPDTYVLLPRILYYGLLLLLEKNFGKGEESGYKHAKLSNSWTQNFVCLAFRDQDKCNVQKNELIFKKSKILNADCSLQEFSNHITNAFPKLKS